MIIATTTTFVVVVGNSSGDGGLAAVAVVVWVVLVDRVACAATAQRRGSLWILRSCPTATLINDPYAFTITTIIITTFNSEPMVWVVMNQ